MTVLLVSIGADVELRARSRRTTVQLPVTGVPVLVLVLPPRALDTNTCADVAVDVTARSQGPTMFLLVMVSTGVPWSFSTIRHPAGSRPGSAPLFVVGMCSPRSDEGQPPSAPRQCAKATGSHPAFSPCYTYRRSARFSSSELDTGRAFPVPPVPAGKGTPA